MSTLRTDTLQTTDSAFTIAVADLATKSDLISPVNNLTDLRLVDSDKVALVSLLGNDDKGIGGGTYYFDPTDTTSAEDLTLGIVVAADGARWKIINETGALSNVQKGISGKDANDNGFELGYTAPGETLNGNGNKFNYYALNVLRDQAVQQVGLNGATGSKVDGLNVTMNFGGPTTRGGRHAIDGLLLQGYGGLGATDPNNQDRNYVGVQGQVLSDTGDGGTGVGDTRGAYFGSSSFAGLSGTANFVRNLTGAEFNTDVQAGTGNRVGFHSGLQIASFIGERGYDLDTAMSVSNLGGSPRGWKYGLSFHGSNGAPAFEADSTVLLVSPTASGSAALDRVVDVRGVTVNTLISANTTSLTDGGLDLFKAASFLNLGPSGVASTPSVTFRSAGLGAAYDTRLISIGGSGTSGTGALQVDGASLITPIVRPVADNAFSCGVPTFRYSVIYSNTGTINTSDAREKTALTALTSAEIEVAKQLAKEIGSYKWLAAITDKGGDARVHIGLTVQRAIEVMEANGLDPMAYGFICYDEWEAVDAVYAEGQSGELELVTEAQPAGNRYGFRHTELLMFLAAGFEARLSALESL